MYPILFHVGSYTVYSYSVALAVGLIAGAWWAFRTAKARLADPTAVIDASFWALVGGLPGGRAGYVLANWAFFGDHLDKALAFRGGGLSWHGALIGAGVAIAAWFAIRSRFMPPLPDWRDLLDSLAPGVALGSAFGWLGCWLTGACYGAKAAGYAPPLSWLTADLRDIYGVDQVRFLTQPLMLAWCLLLWALLWAHHTAPRRTLPRGADAVLYLLLYAAADFGVMFLRGDGTWRSALWLSQWVNVAEMCIAIGLGAYIWTREDRETRGGIHE
jgi:phosphatidylglycerol:prolipoprotein diacylglycerol transferase